MESTYYQSESIEKLAAALSKAQASIMKADKDSKNPFFKSSYADLESVWDAIREPFTSNGLSVAQFPQGAHGLVSILMHTSGQWMRAESSMKPVKDDPQGRGSCLTYMRRYSLQSIAGVCPSDDDGNAASRGGSQPQIYTGAAQQKVIFAKLCDELGIAEDLQRMRELSETLNNKVTMSGLRDAIKKEISNAGE